MKRLRTDNELEYLKKEFADLCAKSGISKHHTVPENPQQNGLVERYNNTILERVDPISFSKIFWVEAVHTTIFFN